MQIALISSGHVLLEDVPGTGKILIAKAMAKSLDTSFKRIQFTPHILPSDLSGINFFNQKESRFKFRARPIFSNIIFIIYPMVLHRGILYVKLPPDEVFPETACWYGLGTYFISYFVFNFVNKLEPYVPFISWMGVISVAVYIFRANTLLIKSIVYSTDKKSISFSVIRYNRIAIALIFAIIFALSGISIVKETIVITIVCTAVFVLSIFTVVSVVKILSSVFGTLRRKNGMWDL